MSKPRCCRRLIFDADEGGSTERRDSGITPRTAANQQRAQGIAEQLKQDAARGRERWGFDFVRDVPVSSPSPYVWECVPAGSVPSFYSRVTYKRKLGVSPKKSTSLPSSQLTFVDAPMLRSVSAPARASSSDSEDLNDSDDGGYCITDGTTTPSAVMFASIAADVHRSDDTDCGPPVKVHRPNPQ